VYVRAMAAIQLSTMQTRRTAAAATGVDMSTTIVVPDLPSSG
jgi:hypothetical protein